MGCGHAKEVVPADDDSMNKPTENGINIDLNDPEVQAAATKIQASFRGHKIRQNLKDQVDDPQQDENDELADIDLTDPDLADAAVKIQAGFRSHLAKKKATPKKDEDKTGNINEKLQNLEMDDELADIDLDDPELNKAATKIQASFRGHKTRKDTTN